MPSLLDAARSSIGKKILMGLTGFGLCLFVVMHLLGNLLIFVGADVFDGYGHMLESNPLLVPAEIGLAIMFVLHVVVAAVLSRENYHARPERYVARESKGGSNVVSRTMILSGAVVAIFIVLHIMHFKFGIEGVDQQDRRELYAGVVRELHNPFMAFGYLLALLVLGLHVSHGLQSAFRSLGLHHSRYMPLLTKISWAFGVLVFVGYSSIPVWALLIKGGAS